MKEISIEQLPRGLVERPGSEIRLAKSGNVVRTLETPDDYKGEYFSCEKVTYKSGEVAYFVLE